MANAFIDLFLFTTDRLRTLVLALVAVAVIKSGLEVVTPPDPPRQFPGMASYAP